MLHVLLTVVLAIGASAVRAQSVYVGANGGVSNWNVDWVGSSSSDKSGSGYRVYGGYNFNDQFGAEVFYLDLGKTSGDPGSEIKGSGYGAAGVFNLHFGSSNDWVFIARLGLASIESTATGTSADGKKTSAQVLAGAGIGYAVTKNLILRADLDATAVKTTDGQSGGVALISGGITLQF
jgi:OOP family OmpA-OmpF porin